MNADQIKATYPGYAGWNDTAAIVADFNATGGAGKGGPTSGGGGVESQESILARISQQRIAANQPAVASYEARMPQVTSEFATERGRLEGEKQPLTDRYTNIINDITQKETTNLGRTFARRGLTTEGGMFGQSVRENVQPLITNATTEREAGIKSINDLINSLGPQETEAKWNLTNAIAQLQTGAGQQAVTDAYSIYQSNAEAKRQADLLAYQKEQATKEQAWNEKVYGETTLPYTQAQIANMGKTTGAGMASTDLANIRKLLGLDETPSTPAPTGEQAPRAPANKGTRIGNWEQIGDNGNTWVYKPSSFQSDTSSSKSYLFPSAWSQ